MCLTNVRVKRQFVKKCKFAYKVFRRNHYNKLVTSTAEMPVRANTKVWQGAYQRVPEHVMHYTTYNKKMHNGKISVFLTLRDARRWTNSDDQIWLVEIKYDELLVGNQGTGSPPLQGALVDKFRLVNRVD